MTRNVCKKCASEDITYLKGSPLRVKCNRCNAVGTPLDWDRANIELSKLTSWSSRV